MYPYFITFLTCISWIRVDNFVKLPDFTILVPCCDVRHDLRVFTMFGSSLLAYVLAGVSISDNVRIG
jgi:hypothetical protein